MIDVRVQPRAKRQAHVWEGETLKVWLTAAPTDGQANEALVAYLANQLGVAKSKVSIISGHKHRNKRVEVEGLALEEVKLKM
jgi:uncharacterized protein (TIGR00251 family)